MDISFDLPSALAGNDRETVLPGSHEFYMRRCLQLAALAQGHTAPNPMVGAVVVYDGRIIGEGYHRCCGEAHAEVNAINSVRDKSLLTKSTLYVSLEPCSHYGKTPPCCELIISCRIPRVVIGCADPFPQVSGRGIGRLREQGIEVITGVLEEECHALNRFFMTFQEKGRPYIILKWAQSADGFIDRQRPDSDPPTRLSDAVTRLWAHRLRATCDAILVGTRTAIADNPSLTTRYWSGKNPLRIAIDRNGILPAQAHLLDGTTPTLIVGHCTSPAVDVLPLPPGGDAIETLIPELARRKIQSLLVEGGARLLQSFIHAELWDEARIETAPLLLRDGIAAPHIEGCKKQINVHSPGRYTTILTRR